MRFFIPAVRVLSLSILLLFVAMEPSLAQRNQKNKKSDKLQEEESDNRVSEFYFIDGEKYFLLEDYAKSLVSFKKSAEITPDNSVVYYMIAQIMLENEQFNKAEDNISKAIELESGNKYYYLVSASIYTAQANFEKASEVYLKMINTIPETEKYYVELAGLYLYQNKLDEALNAFNHAEEKTGVNEQLSLQKQQIYLKQNKIEEAITEGIELMNTYPGETRYVVNVAEVMHANNQSEKAIKLLESYLAENKDDSHIKLMLSEYYRQDGKLEESSELISEAFSDFYLDTPIKIQVMVNYISKFPDEYYVKEAFLLGETLIETHPDNGEVYLVNADMITELVTTSEPDDEKELQENAASYYYKSIQFDASNFSVWRNLLNIELQLNRWDDLISHSEEALEYFPNNSLIYLYAGIGHQRRQNFDEAISYFEQGRKMATDPQILGSFYSSLGDSYNAIKNYSNSDKNYDLALELTPDNDVVLNNYSYFLSLRKEHLDKARRMSQQVMRRNSDNSTYLDTFAWVLYQLEEYDEAKRILEQAIEIQDSNAVYYDHYGDVLYRLGDVSGAVENWERAQGLNKNLQDIEKKIAKRKIFK